MSHLPIEMQERITDMFDQQKQNQPEVAQKKTGFWGSLLGRGSSRKLKKNKRSLTKGGDNEPTAGFCKEYPWSLACIDNDRIMAEYKFNQRRLPDWITNPGGGSRATKRHAKKSSHTKKSRHQKMRSVRRQRSSRV